MLEVLFIEQNDSWMEKASTLGLDCGFHVVLVRVVNGIVYMTVCAFNRVMIRVCAQLQGISDNRCFKRMAASSETAVRSRKAAFQAQRSV